ncbi:MAG: sigma-54 dependent transcriptional regulator [Desulfobacteria bacterium]|jgi:DNA-binding NtrC family response regulator
MELPEKILIADDEKYTRSYFEILLGDAGYITKSVTSGYEAIKMCYEDTFDLVLLDIRMSDIDGIKVLKQLKEIDHELSVIMITAYGTMENVIETMKMGACDFLTKPFEDSNKVLISIKNGLSQRKLKKENIYLKSQLDFQVSGIVGKNKKMKATFELIRKSALVNSNVLVEGESGTGKELVARAIHQNSPRSDKRFLGINCTALPENLLESTLFGYEKGAFTGAHRTTKGYFEEADGGTLFLDEIGDTNLSFQVKLLRVIQDREFIRVGGTKSVPIDIRLVAASSGDLQKKVDSGSFQLALYYRLNVIRILLPPLRERKDDIPLLVDHFLKKLSNIIGVDKKDISADALDTLINYRWDGNVRELENVIERAIVFQPEKTITVRDLPNYIMEEPKEKSEKWFALSSFEKARDEFEKRYIQELLDKTEGNLNEAAALAELHPSTLYRKIKRHKT